MQTRRTRFSTTPQIKKRETTKIYRVMPNPISKKHLRKLIKNRLTAITHQKSATSRHPAKSLKSQLRSGIAELIDRTKCECPICLQIAIQPIVLPCGHCYCLKCFEQNSIFNLRCCLCRLPVDPEDLHPGKLVQNFIDSYILPTSSEGISYWCRKGEFEEWQAKRTINVEYLRVGDSVDFRTVDNVWTRGVIVCLIYQQQQFSLKIKYCQNAQIEQLTVPAASRRLAPFGFFSKGQYLKYRTINYESRFIESIEIPQIKCDFIDESGELSVLEEKLSPEGRDWSEEQDLALELFDFEMKQWDKVFELS